MSWDLREKTVVITGGNIGIGYEIADKYLEKCAKIVILLGRNEDNGAKAFESLTEKYGNGKAVFFKCDVTSDLEEIFRKIIDTYQYVDILINNAGVLNETEIRNTIDVNVTALIEWSFKFWEHMRKDKSGKGGTIINIASIYGYRVDQYVPVYQASKFAVMGFTKSFGHIKSFNEFGVRVVAICPGFTETRLVADPKTVISDVGFKSFTKKQEWQTVDVVGNAAVEVFETADSGTAWLIEGAKPIKLVL
ncbi:unnamed protein product [Parnassius apollo]|uniref:(apollo) hypothetical protein n=1 Tax=Parnassius apollo TaxID=110799 RepID=A0A8S3X182_PARAO|nr:unnamed protein product [Parnassius apollo]